MGKADPIFYENNNNAAANAATVTFILTVVDF
jgi:hypothetical protein